MNARLGLSVGFSVLVLASVGPALAADVTWVGAGGDGLWGTATNWSNNAVPGASDRPVITTNGFSSAVKRILLGESRTVNELRFNTSSVSADNVIIDGEETYTLTIKNGTVSGPGWGTPKINSAMSCDVILGASGSWTLPENWQSVLSLYGRVTDEGNGYSVSFGGNQNMYYVIGGPWEIAGSLSLLAAGARIGGVYTNASGAAFYGGSVTNAAGVYLDGRMSANDQSETTLTIENLYQADSDRIRGATKLGAKRTGGSVIFYGNATSPVVERVSALDLQSGRLGITVTGRTAGTNTDLIFDAVLRASGTAMGVATNVGGRLIVEGAVNTNGIWQPWCFFGNYYSKVFPSNVLSSTFNADYAAPAATGNDPAKLYRFTASSLALGETSSMWGLKWDSSSAQTLDLGSYDLTIGCGAMIVGGSLNKTIASSGGRLIFGGEDVVYYVEGSGAFTNSAPVAWSKPAGSPYAYPSLVFSRGNRTDGIVLDGEDQIGSYSNLFCHAYYSSARRTLTLAGPSDRVFYGTVNGLFDLAKRGAGTLTFAGPNERRSGSFSVYEGRVVLAHASAPSPTIYDGASCEVPAGATLSSVTITVQTNGTLCGLGTTGALALRAGARVAPGTADTVGTLTCGTHTYLSTNLVLAVRLGALTNDLLRVSGNLTLPPTGETIGVEVSDASGGVAPVKGKSFVVGTWTGTDPFTSPTWNVTTATPALLDVSAASVAVDSTGNRLVLSGLRRVSRGTVVLIL
jgi:hypothetical protein